MEKYANINLCYKLLKLVQDDIAHLIPIFLLLFSNLRKKSGEKCAFLVKV